MKKTLIVLLTAVLSISMLFVSCSNEAKFDETVQIGFSSASVRGLIASQDIPGANDLYWFYKAAKTPGKEGVNINYGAQSGWTPVKVGAKGLTPEGSNGLITLAQGRWDFELQGRKDAADESTAVYQGSTSNVLIVKNGETVNSITVPVSQLATGTGTVLLSKDITVKRDDSNISGYKPTSYKYSLSGKNEWTIKSNVDFSSDITEKLTAATYDFVVMYDSVDGGKNITYASAPITITVSANITTTITGSLDVEKTMGQFGVKVVGSTATAPVTPSATESKTVVVPISPSKEQGTKTTVTLPANSISEGTTNVKLTVKNLTSNEVNNQFTVTDGKALSAGISLTLVGTENGTEDEITDFKGNYVTIETFIDKNLSNVVVRYNGTDDQPVCNNAENPSNVADDLDSNDSYVYGYSPTTGRLVFKTNHFSDYYIEAKPVCKTDNVKYASIHDAVDNASDGDTIVLLENISMNLGSKYSCISIDNKNITIDGSGNNITLTANTVESGTYGIFIKGDDSSKTFTIKNATINTTKLERAIRTEGNIGVVIEDCTITTNGCGIHVKGANEVEIDGTRITVEVIDNAAYAAHLRTAVMVGGKEADVTVTGSTINAINSAKTESPLTWCKGLYVGTGSENAKITAIDNEVTADYSIAIDGSNLKKKPTQIVIKSGTYEGAIGSPSGYSYKSLTIEGGTFSGISDLNSFNGKDNDIAKLVISGGTFPFNPDNKYISEGYHAVEKSDHRFSIEEAPVATVTFKDGPTTKYFASNSYDVADPNVTGFDDTNWSNEYKALSRAFYDVGRSGGKIVINQDLNFGEHDDSGLEIIGDYTKSTMKPDRFKKAGTVNEVILDLAGHTINFNYSEADTHYTGTINFANINVTIQDSSAEKTGKIRSHHLRVLSLLGNVVLRVEGGSFLTDCVNGSFYGKGIMKGGDYVYDDDAKVFVPGQVSMTGGTLSYPDAMEEANSITQKTYLETFIEGNVAEGYTAEFDETTGCITVVVKNK